MSTGKETNTKSETRGKWRALPTWQVVALLILFFPIGIYLLWRQDRWSKRTKKITTWATSAVVVTFFVIVIVFAPPTVSVTSSLASVRSDSYQLAGKIYPSNSEVTVNGVRAAVSGDKFTSNVPLKEGDNTLKVVVVSGGKRTEQEFKIHRYTKAEVAAQEKAAAEKKTAQAAAKAKADADAAKKQTAQAAAKAKADADAAAKAAKDKAASEAAAKARAEAAALAAATVSQKNALGKAKSYLSYTAFSYQGLIEQLEYEQFSTADATYGADHVGANWNEQAAKKAKSYMSYSSFSRGSLIDQLKYEKFTPEQAAYGASSVGL